MATNHQPELSEAVCNGEASLVKKILQGFSETEKCEHLITPNEYGVTAVHFAAEKGSAEKMEIILNSVLPENRIKLLETVNKEGNTPLHWASVYNRSETMKCIIEAVPRDDMYKLLLIRNVNGYTALHRTAYFQRLKPMECILDFLAQGDPEKVIMVQDKSGDTIIQTALERGYTEPVWKVLHRLSQEDAFNLLKARNNQGRTAIHQAAFTYHTDTLAGVVEDASSFLTSEQLLDLIMTKDTGGNNVVHSVAFTEDTNSMECLLDRLNQKHQQDVLSCENVNNLRPIDIAKRCDMDDMVDCIEKYPQSRQPTALESPTNVGLQHVNGGDSAVMRDRHPSLQMSESAYSSQSKSTNLEQEFPPDIANHKSSQPVPIGHNQDSAKYDSEGTKKRESETTLSPHAQSELNDKTPTGSLNDSGRDFQYYYSTQRHKEGLARLNERSGSDTVTTNRRRTSPPGGQAFNSHDCPTNEGSSSISEDEVQEIMDYKPAPRQLYALINRLCKENNVKSAIITQSSKDWREVLVLGVNASSIQTELEKMLKEDPVFTGFHVFVDDEIKPVRKKALSLTVFKNRTSDINNNRRWREVRSSTCELLVQAEKTGALQSNFHCDKAVFAVVPAHFILNKNQINNARRADPAWRRNVVHTAALTNQDGPIECDHHVDEAEQYDRDIDSEDESVITQVRQQCEARASRRIYSIQRRKPIDEENSRRAEIKHPILLCYRQNIFSRQEHEHVCPIGVCQLDPIATCAHIFMNDIALLPLEFDDAVHFQRELQLVLQSNQRSVKTVQSVDKLWQLHEEQRIVKVRGTTGNLRFTFLPEDDGQKICEQLTFVLTSEPETTLDDGDCGTIVYLKSKRTSNWKPLGMFVGMMELNTTRLGFTERIYQAVVLSQAFKDLESEYPHRIGPIQPFKPEFS